MLLCNRMRKKTKNKKMEAKQQQQALVSAKFFSFYNLNVKFVVSSGIVTFWMSNAKKWKKNELEKKCFFGLDTSTLLSCWACLECFLMDEWMDWIQNKNHFEFDYYQSQKHFMVALYIILYASPALTLAEYLIYQKYAWNVLDYEKFWLCQEPIGFIWFYAA